MTGVGSWVEGALDSGPLVRSGAIKTGREGVGGRGALLQSVFLSVQLFSFISAH